MRVVLNKKFKDDDEGGENGGFNTNSMIKEEQSILDEMQEEIKESHMQFKGNAFIGGNQNRSNFVSGKDSDMKILESDYSNSTFHLAS